MNLNQEIAFICGDNRQIYLANMFVENNWSVYTYNLTSPYLSTKCIKCNDIASIIQSNTILIFPFKIDSLLLKELCSITHILKNKIIFGGGFPNRFLESLSQFNVIAFDFLKTDYISRLNAIATAEGCIKEAICLSPYNLHGTKSLVLGYGNCGCVLANKLHNLDSLVTVCCRNSYQKSCALSQGLKCIDIFDINTNIHKYLFIFNTIPSLILDESVLKYINTNAIIIDIASLPGGVDFKYANSINLKSVNIPGIPGKFSPMSSAIILFDYILDSLSNIQVPT